MLLNDDWHAETQLLERPRCSITTAMPTGEGSFNGAVGAFALNNNETGFSNNAIGDSALFRNITGAQNTAIGDLALENNDATGTAAPISTRQLALWRS